MTDPTLADLRNELREHSDVAVPAPPDAALLVRAAELRKTRSRWALIAVAAGVLAVVGVGVTIAGGSGTDDRVVPAGEPTSTTTDQPAEDPTTAEPGHADTYVANLVPQSSDVTDDDLALVNGLISIARNGVYDDPQLEAMKALVEDYPFAEHVHLGYGPGLREVTRSKLVLPRNWETDTTGGAERDGVLSVIDQIDWYFSMTSDTPPGPPFKVSIGDQPRCDGGTPTRFAAGDGLRKIAIEPPTTASCEGWFSVNLYQDDAGKVAAISLDRANP